MRQYSDEYKESLANEFVELHELYNKVIAQAGEGPYNEEEQQIISDYEDVCEEYEEVFNKKPKYKIPFFQKIYSKRELPASKREPAYCDNISAEIRHFIPENYLLVHKGKGVS